MVTIRLREYLPLSSANHELASEFSYFTSIIAAILGQEKRTPLYSILESDGNFSYRWAGLAWSTCTTHKSSWAPSNWCSLERSSCLYSICYGTTLTLKIKCSPMWLKIWHVSFLSKLLTETYRLPCFTRRSCTGHCRQRQLHASFRPFSL